MFFEKPRLVAVMGALLGIAILSSAEAAFVAVGTYDEQISQPNAVDSDAGSFSGSGTQLTVTGSGDFDDDVAAAFSQGLGGVIDFDSGSLTDGTTIDVTYAAGSKNLQVTRTDGNYALSVTAADGTNQQQGTAISGTEVLAGFGYTGYELSLAVGPITDVGSGATLDEKVVELGFTILSRDRGGYPTDVTATANYSGGGQGLIGPETIDQANGMDDTFFGFRAPSGQYITSVDLTSTTGFLHMDDLAFITVPEPCALTLVNSGCLGLLLWRRFSRRRRCC